MQADGTNARIVADLPRFSGRSGMVARREINHFGGERSGVLASFACRLTVVHPRSLKCQSIRSIPCGA